MEQEKRALLAVALCLLALLGWPYLTSLISGKTPPSSQVPPAAENKIAAPANTPSGAAAPAAPTAAPAGPTVPGAAPAPAAPVIAPEQRIVVEHPGFYRAEVTTYGAGLTSYELLDSKYWSRDRRRPPG